MGANSSSGQSAVVIPPQRIQDQAVPECPLNHSSTPRPKPNPSIAHELLERCPPTDQLASGPALVITDEASPLHLFSTRNRLRKAVHQGCACSHGRSTATGDAGAFGAPSRLVLCQQIVSTAASRRHARQDVASTCHCRRAAAMWCGVWRGRRAHGGRTRFTRQRPQVRNLSRPLPISAGQSWYGPGSASSPESGPPVLGHTWGIPASAVAINCSMVATTRACMAGVMCRYRRPIVLPLRS
jgi:hypothetical protein